MFYATLGNKGQTVNLRDIRKLNTMTAIRFTPTIEQAILALRLEEMKLSGNINVFIYEVADGDYISTEEVIRDFGDFFAAVTNEQWLKTGDSVDAKLVQVVTVKSASAQPAVVKVGENDVEYTKYDYTDAGSLDKYNVKTMDIVEWYCEALRYGMYIFRRWVYDVMSVKREYKMTGPYTLSVDESKHCFYSFLEDGTRVDLTGVGPGSIPVSWWKEVTAQPGWLPNIKEPVKTTTGELFVNAAAFCYQFGDAVPYIAGKIMPKTLNGVFKDLRKRKLLTPELLVKALTMIEQMPTYANIAVPTASRATFTTHPKMKEKRKELMEKYKDKLSDPAVRAKIDAELIALDKEHIKGSVSEPFFIKEGKMHGVVRKKTMMVYGSERSIDGGDTAYIDRPLTEGWRPEDMPAIANALRAGAYLRGNLTALGGVDVKRTQRNLAGAKIVEVDCGSKRGIRIRLTNINYTYFDGWRFVDKPEVVQTTDMLKALIGKTVVFRTIGYCKTPPNGCCEYCAGDTIKDRKNALALEASNIGSASMGAMMQATHGKVVKTNYFDLQQFTS